MSQARDLAEGDHQLIGEIIGDSFSDDPVNLWTFAKPESITDYYTMVAKKLYLPQGYGHVMANGSGGAMWLPPGKKKHIPLWHSLDIGYSMLRHGGLESLTRGLAVDAFLGASKPVEPHYYLFAIGARQGHQGKGIGGKLMLLGLERVDADNKPAYLESSKEANVSFYRRFGFEVIQKVVPAKACPPLWLMWREARA